MAKTKNSEVAKRGRPPLSPDAEENEMIALATDAARKKLEDGTAPSQIIVHYLRLGTSLARLEKKRLEADIELQKSKRKMIDNTETGNEMYEKALRAFRVYNGQGEPDDY